MPSASGLTHKAGLALDFLERMANDCILHPGGARELRAEDLDFRLDSWRRLRTNRLRGDIDSKEVSQLFRDANLLNHMVHALEGLQTSASLLQQKIQLRLEPIISKLSNGIASLSDELIMLVFEFTVPVGEQILRKPYQPPQASQPILLSHVSRRFRNAALKTPQLWTTLDGHACRNEQEAFIARSGEESDLHIIIHASMYGSTISGFLDICLPLAWRWKTLLVTSDGAWDTPNVVDALLRDIFGSRAGGTGERFFPRLQELYVKDTGRNSTFPGTIPENRFEPEAEIPSLLHLRCHGYTPARSPAYSSVKSFRSAIPMPAATYDSDLQNLCSFLASLRAMTDLDLTFHHASEHYIKRLNSLRAPCPSVTSLSLNFPSYRFPGAIAFVNPLVALLELPLLIELSISVDLRMGDIINAPEDEENLENLMIALFPNPSTHPNLASVKVRLSDTEDGCRKGQAWSAMRSKSLRIPLKCMPHVTTLSVQTFTDVEVVHGPKNGKRALRELCFRECTYFDVASLEKLVTSLRQENAWKTLETLKLEKCGHFLEYNDVAKIVGEEKLSFTNIGLEELL